MSNKRQHLDNRLEQEGLPKAVQHHLADKNLKSFSDGDIIIAVKRGMNRYASTSRPRSSRADFMNDLYADEREALLEGARRYLLTLEPQHESLAHYTPEQRKIDLDL